MEAKKSFVEACTSRSKDQPEPQLDLSMLTTFLDTCIKLLQDNKVVKGLQELTTSCLGTVPGEPCIVRKLEKHTTRT